MAHGPLLQAQAADGLPLLMPEQSGTPLRDSEAEIERLPRELARPRGEDEE